MKCVHGVFRDAAEDNYKRGLNPTGLIGDLLPFLGAKSPEQMEQYQKRMAAPLGGGRETK